MAFGRFTGTVSFSAELTKDVDVSASIQDARLSVPALFDDTGTEVSVSIQAISATTFRISSEFALTANFTLVVIGTSPVAAAPVGPQAPILSTPTLTKTRTYAQARDKLLVDLDLLDETFVTPDELIGYFNEGIEEAESEILKIDEDYFLTSIPIPLLTGQSEYDYPQNIYGYKVRGISYSNQSKIYDIPKFRRNNKFSHIAFSKQYSVLDDYQWYHTNNTAGDAKINLVPAAQETAILSPVASEFTPMTLWYIRHATRVPLMGEYIYNWETFNQDESVDPVGDQIITAAVYVTGDKVKFLAVGSAPGGVTIGTVYFVIKGSGYIKLATTLQNALAGTAIDLTSVGSGLLSLSMAATQTIIDATLMDVPEFLKFIIQWAKCRCMEKEGDPRLPAATATLKQQREQMVSTLTEIQVDDNNTIEQDFSAYTEMS